MSSSTQELVNCSRIGVKLHLSCTILLNFEVWVLMQQAYWYSYIHHISGITISWFVGPSTHLFKMKMAINILPHILHASSHVVMWTVYNSFPSQFLYIIIIIKKLSWDVRFPYLDFLHSKEFYIPYGSKFSWDSTFINFGNALHITKILALKILVFIGFFHYEYINAVSKKYPPLPNQKLSYSCIIYIAS